LIHLNPPPLWQEAITPLFAMNLGPAKAIGQTPEFEFGAD
jgi:hypothetical protein